MIRFGQDGRPIPWQRIELDEPGSGEEIRVVDLRVRVPVVVGRDVPSSNAVEAAVRRVWNDLPDVCFFDLFDVYDDDRKVVEEPNYPFLVECYEHEKAVMDAVLRAKREAEENDIAEGRRERADAIKDGERAR